MLSGADWVTLTDLCCFELEHYDPTWLVSNVRRVTKGSRIAENLWNALAATLAVQCTFESAIVQVFGRRDAETIPTLGQPASEKRQGTKSRGVGHRQCSGCYGDLASA